MRHAYLCAVFLLASSGTALANGGGYSFGVTFTGSVAPFQASGTEKVRILDEKLDVALRRGDAAVVVRYTMKNVTDQPATVKFGFPVEADPPGDEGEQGDFGGPAPGLKERKQFLAQAIPQLKGYSVTADGAPVTSELQLEQFSTGGIKPFPGAEKLRGIAGWMVSEVTFPAESARSIEIRYSADHAGAVTYVSDDTRARPRSFVYRLSTGAVWQGTIGKGTVTIRADGIPPEEVEITSPRDRFKRDGDRWLWAFEELEPTLADDINVQAVPGYFLKGFVYDEELRAKGVRSFLERGGAWGEGHQRFKAKASSTLPRTKAHDFGPQHLADNEFVAPWSEGVAGTGIGEWVELEPTRPAPLLALQISPGFSWRHDKKSLFEANGRPSRVEILLNGEHRFSADLQDKAHAQLVPIIGYAKPVTKLRITIQGVYSGKKYDDTCISGVVLYDRLSKAPPVQPAR